MPEYHRGGVWLPGLELWLDPHENRSGPERVFVSHAHSDHTGDHREVIVSEATARLMQARLGGQRLEHRLAFGEPRDFNTGGLGWRITLLPAGHILGSAMACVEAGGESLLYTGDFKLRRGLSAEPCEPRHASTLIMETTYGRPGYLFPPTDAVMAGVIRFCREALDNDEVPVLLGYSLGKSQEVLRGLAGAGLPVQLHDSVRRLTGIYEELGQQFPPYERIGDSNVAGKVVICPPASARSGVIRKLGRIRTAVLTGWAVDPDCRYRYQTDAAFPLSDHADFPELIEFVRQVAPRRVLTLHGFAADFARVLREQGLEAYALSESEQLVLPLGDPSRERTPRRGLHEPSAPPVTRKDVFVDASRPFKIFAATCEAVTGVRGKLEKVALVAACLRSLEPGDLTLVASWFCGHPFPPSRNRGLQLGWAVIRDALCDASGLTLAAFKQIYLKHSDAGETAAEMLALRPAEDPPLTLRSVGQLMDQLHAAKGPTGKLPRLVEGLRRCAPDEAKFLVKILTGDLRIGLKEGLVEDAIAAAFEAPSGDVRRANLLLGDINDTAVAAKTGTLGSATVQPFRPVRCMLASPEKDAPAIWERMGQASPSAARPVRVWVEDKYDGIRCQLHMAGRRVALYSRDLKDVTATFPEITDAIQSVPEEFILDGEILAMDGDRVLPFADLQRRLGRRERDLFIGREIPVRYVAFDLLWKSGRPWIDEPLRRRRATLETLAARAPAIQLARISEAVSPEDIDRAFDAARDRGNEGLMVKDPESAYTPGRRGLSWLKLKRALATLDCVVVAVEYGHGKRRQVLSDYTFAVRDDETGELRTIGKAYSGLTDVEIAALTAHFLSRTLRHHGRHLEVEPDVVLEIAFDSLRPSDRHSSGLAMRFPRIVRIREDKSRADIDSIATARRLLKP